MMNILRFLAMAHETRSLLLAIIGYGLMIYVGGWLLTLAIFCIVWSNNIQIRTRDEN